MHVLYFWTSLLAVLAFAPAMLGPGYLLAYGLDLGGFRRRMRWPEQAMWSVALSAAVAILIAVYGGLVLGSVHVGVVFALCGVATAVLQWTTAREEMPSGWLRQRPVKTVWIAVTAICAFLLLAAAGVEVRGRLMEGVAAGDWSVRGAADRVCDTDGDATGEPVLCGGWAGGAAALLHVLVCAVRGGGADVASAGAGGDGGQHGVGGGAAAERAVFAVADDVCAGKGVAADAVGGSVRGWPVRDTGAGAGRAGGAVCAGVAAAGDAGD